MLARSPRIGAGAEVFAVAFFVDTDRSDISFAPGYPCNKGVVLGVGEPVDMLHMRFSPTENSFSGPVVQIIEGHFAQIGIDGFHFQLLVALSALSEWPCVAQLILPR